MWYVCNSDFSRGAVVFSDRNAFHKCSSRKLQNNFQISNAKIQESMSQDHIFEIQESPNVLESLSLLGSPESVVTVLTLVNVGRSCYCIAGNTGLNEINPTSDVPLAARTSCIFVQSALHCLWKWQSVKCHGSWSWNPLPSKNFLQLCHLSLIATWHLKWEQWFVCMLVLMFTCTCGIARQNVDFCKLC